MKIKNFQLEISQVCSDFIVIKYRGYAIVWFECNGGSMFVDDEVVFDGVDVV